MSRAERVLGVLPAFYRATEPGKLIGEVVQAIAGPIEEADTHLFRIQRAHRLLVAEQPEDVIRLSAALNLTAFYFEDLLADPKLDDQTRLDTMRDRVQRIARLHLEGLGTARAILEAGAIFLNGRIVPDRDGAPLVRHVDPEGFVHSVTIELELLPGLPRTHIYLYENPLRRKKVDSAARWYLDSWAVDNESLEPARLTFLVQGVGERTVRPRVFSPDMAEGILFDGIVPNGATLLLDPTRGARLDGLPVDDWLVHFRSGIFDYAEVEGANHSVDDGGHTYAPFDGDITKLVAHRFQPRRSVPACRIGRSSWLFSTAPGVCDGSDFDYAGYATDQMPRGVFDGDVSFDGCVFDLPASGVVGMAWEERVPCAFKLVLPPPAYLESEGSESRINYLGRLSGILPRFKPAGVRAYLDNGRETWVLGEGVIRRLDATDGEGIDRNVTLVRGPFADGFVPVTAA